MELLGVGDLCSEISELFLHGISRWAAGGTGQPRALSAMYKFHHGFYQVTMRTMRTPSFSMGRAGKSVQ